MKKRGSHIGMMLSFVIFIIFLLFLYTALRPQMGVQKNKKDTLDNLEKNFLEKVQENLTTATVYKNSGTCIQVKIDWLQDSNFVVRKTDGEHLNATKSDDNLIIAGIGLIKIFISEENLSSYGTTGVSGCGDANISVLTSKQEVFESKISEITEDYIYNYELLKEELFLPSEYEFEFSFEFENGSIIDSQNKNTIGEIYASEKEIFYLNKNAELVRGKIILKVW